MSVDNNLIRRVKEEVPGVYMRLGDPHILIIHMDEIIEHKNLDDTEETRATLWAAFDSHCVANDLILEIVETDKVNDSALDPVISVAEGDVITIEDEDKNDAS